MAYCQPSAGNPEPFVYSQPSAGNKLPTTCRSPSYATFARVPRVNKNGENLSPPGEMGMCPRTRTPLKTAPYACRKLVIAREGAKRFRNRRQKILARLGTCSGGCLTTYLLGVGLVRAQGHLVQGMHETSLKCVVRPV